MGSYTDDKMFTGSGVLLVENYRSCDNETIPSVLVALNRSSNVLMDFGGGYSKKHGRISQTASDELLEESRNLIDVSADFLEKSKYFDIRASANREEYYRVYVIKVRNIASKYYNYNKQLIDSNKDTKYQWRETSSIHHIPLSSIDFHTLLDRKTVMLTDVHNNTFKTHMRLRKAMAIGKSIFTDVLESIPAVSNSDLIIETNPGFLKGTYSFKQ
jgi:hypothetical protein